MRPGSSHDGVGLAVLLLIALAGLVSGASVLLLVVVLQALGFSSTGSSGSRLFAAALDVAGGRPSLGLALTLLVGATAAQGVVGRMQSIQTLWLVDDVTRGVRRRLFGDICGVPWNVYTRFRQSDLVEVLVQQTNRVGFATRSLVLLAASCMTAIVYVALAAGISLAMTAVVLGFGAALTLLLARERREVARAGEGYLVANRRLFSSLMDALAGMKTVRAYGAERRHATALESAESGLHDVHLRLVGTEGRMKAWFDLGATTLLAAVTLVSASRLAISAAELVVLIFVFVRLAPQLSAVHHQYQSVLADLPALGAVESFASLCRVDAAGPVGPPEAIAFERDIELRDVVFAYASEPVLRGVTVTIPAGRMVAVVGPSGAGKSTIADLVLGLLTPDAGQLLVDGRPLSAERLPAWRALIGYVPQDGFLYHDSIRGNLLWAAPGADETEMRAALVSAGAGSVDRLPQGLDTPVGDRGALLSGGERQRVALAQALLRKPKLLILDEATSSLDAESERTIEQAIGSLQGRVTILRITHRLASVRSADFIYVVDGGRIVESGRWDELRARPFGRLRALSEAQGLPSSGARATFGQMELAR